MLVGAGYWWVQNFCNTRKGGVWGTKGDSRGRKDEDRKDLENVGQRGILGDKLER